MAGRRCSGVVRLLWLRVRVILERRPIRRRRPPCTITERRDRGVGRRRPVPSAAVRTIRVRCARPKGIDVRGPGMCNSCF